MTRCTFFRGENGRLISFEVSGHAGYAEAGEDIVCAGISSSVMLICNLLETSFQAKGRFQEKDDTVICKPENPTDAHLLLIEGFYDHISSLAADYPQFIEVCIKSLGGI